MLLRPPFIQQEDVKSQSSNPISHFDKQPSVKSTSKNKKKQNSLGMRKHNFGNTNSINQSNASISSNVQKQLQVNALNYDSDNGSVHSVNSRKSKGKTKQSTLAIGKKPNNYQNNDDISPNNQYSVTKLNQHQQYQIFKLDSDDDNKSVGSHASKNSKKNAKKQNSLGRNRPNKANVQLNYYYNNQNQNQNNEQYNQKSPEQEQEQQHSKVQTVRLNQSVQVSNQPLKYNQVFKLAPKNQQNLLKNIRNQQPKSKENQYNNYRKPEQAKKRRTEQHVNRQTSSPFEQITLKRQSDDDQPVYVLKQEPTININKGNKNIFSQKAYEVKQLQRNPLNKKQKYQDSNNLNPKTFKLQLQESHTIQPQMISTKSVASKSTRRNKIFDDNNHSVANTSNVMSSRTNNIEGSFEKSRSKSKSKLGDLLKQSRQKKAQLSKSQQKISEAKPIFAKKNESPLSPDNFFSIQKQNLTSIGTLNEQPKFIGGQKIGQNVIKMQQIKKKSIESQFFDLGQSQLDLNLSMSNKINAEPSGIKGDSLHFNFQPEKKKGISITSKQKPNQSRQEKSLESKRHLDRLMKKCQQNQEFLAKSILSNNSELKQSKKTTLNEPLQNINKKQDKKNRPFDKIHQQVDQQEPAWHQLVKNQEQFKIKQVQRRQIKRPSQQEIKNNLAKVEQNKAQSIEKQFSLKNKGQKKNSQQNELNLNNNKFIQPTPVYNNEKQKQVNNKQKQNIEKQKNKLLANLQAKSLKQRQQRKDILSSQQQQRRQPTQYMQPNTKQSKQPNYIVQHQSKSAKEQYQSKIQSSAISNELSLSQNGSERSNSQNKKTKKKQSSLNIMKKHKIQVRDQSPRAQQSFYEEPQNKSEKQNKSSNQNQLFSNFDQQKSSKMGASRTKVQYKKPNLINFQQSDEQQQRVKSKTDINFYNYGQMSQKSMKPPSSKPPLSKKSGCSSSKSKSKAKQSTLNINVIKKQNKMAKPSNNNNQKPQQKKKTLLDIAQDKDYEGSGYGSDSQCSFNSRESFGSVNSRGSRKSSTSKKQSTLPITIKHKGGAMNLYSGPGFSKMESANSQIEVYDRNQSIYNKFQQSSQKKTSRQRQMKNQEMQARTIVSKDTYFIDQRGRLVKQDLIIQGNHVFGRPNQRGAQQMAVERMKRSRQQHRSRSKSRQGGNSRLSRKNSTTSYQESGYQSASSSNYFNGRNSQTNYTNQKKNLYIEQFIKPVQQAVQAVQKTNQNYKFEKPSNTKQMKLQQQYYENEEPYENYYNSQEEQPVKNITLNELFGRNKNTSKGQKQQNTYQNNPQYQNNYPGQSKNIEKSKYGQRSAFNGQESAQSAARKKSLSRTQKTFYNNR